MDKFYITFGDFTYCCLGLNPADACGKTFRAFLKRDIDENSNIVALPRQFIVSSKGFDEHGDDLHVPTSTIVRDMERSNNDNFEQDV